MIMVRVSSKRLQTDLVNHLGSKIRWKLGSFSVSGIRVVLVQVEYLIPQNPMMNAICSGPYVL